MKQFWNYLRSRQYALWAFFLFAVILTASFALYRLPVDAVLYPVLLCAFLGAAFLTVDFLRERARCRTIRLLEQQIVDSLCDLPEAQTPCEEAYRGLVLRLRDELLSERAAAELSYRDMVDYYTVWAHQIKTPIASMKLTLQNEDSPLARKLSADLFRTQQYVDMVLAFLRLGSDSTDYVFREHALDALVRPSVKKFSSEFIGRKLSLRCEIGDETVVTDEKWFAFVLEQLLSNALKYTRVGGIRIETRAGGVLCISDTGVGIAPEDLPRIFEKGYTGLNGRADRSASGLGLYLCRRVCDNLGIPIRIESELGKGTCVFLDLSRKRPVAE